jgi:lipoprotein-anchoring transpeptidase ErfK/SrfK
LPTERTWRPTGGFQTWYWQHPEQRERFQDRLDLLARRIYFQPKPHYIAPYRVQSGDRMETIAREYRQSWEYLAKLNRVDPERIQAGQELKVLQGPFSVVVDLSRFELTVHAHGYYVTRFPVGIGKEGATPVGTFRVTDKVTDPTYYGEEGVIAHDDPANPLGKRWIAINNEEGTLQGYGIHGTIEPSSIGKAVSRGCIRLNDGTSPTCTTCSPSVPK